MAETAVLTLTRFLLERFAEDVANSGHECWGEYRCCYESAEKHSVKYAALRQVVLLEIPSVNQLLALPYTSHPDYNPVWRPRD